MSISTLEPVSLDQKSTDLPLNQAVRDQFDPKTEDVLDMVHDQMGSVRSKENHWGLRDRYYKEVDYNKFSESFSAWRANKSEKTVNTVGQVGNTFLHFCVYYQLPQSVNELIAAKANVNLSNNDGQTPLHYAVEGPDPAIVLNLVAAGARVAAQNKDGNTPFHFASGNKDYINVLRSSFRGDKEALAAAVNLPNKDGDTPLHFSLQGNNGEIVELLIRAGAKVETQNEVGDTSFHVAVKSDSLTRALIASYGAHKEALMAVINTPNKPGFTPLEYAVKSGRVDVATLLISAGATVAKLSSESNTVFHSAAGNEAMTRLLLDSYSGDNATVETLINTPDTFGRTALDYAYSAKANMGTVQLLIDLGGTTTPKTHNQSRSIYVSSEQLGMQPIIQAVDEVGFSPKITQNSQMKACVL